MKTDKYGRNGTGKSHMATTIGVEARIQGKKFAFYKTAVPVMRSLRQRHDKDRWKAVAVH